ncbi:ABC transporter substrate-binding protein [Paenibacillus sp. y28]|uniref:ABC transporter substrate-binding protein n=1 Tax=Paenibacillus sp. y28 TaxID=3129110 RepID=UPI003015B25E
MNKLTLLIMTALLCAVIGCSSTAPTTSGAAGSGANSYTIQDFAGRTVSFPEVPNNIVALSNGELELIYALGSKVVGRPTSTSPVPVKEAADVQQVGSTHGIDLEKIAALSPDVVLGNNPLNTKDIASVEGIGSKMVLTNANSIEEIKKQIQLFGQMLQQTDKANELTQAIDTKVKELQAAQGPSKVRVLMVYGAPGTYMAALNNSLSGDILNLAGGENIAADYPSLESYPQYAQLNTEKMIKSNPQIVLLMTHGDTTKVKEGFLKEMQQNAAWNSLDAVKNNHVEVLPSDLFGTNPGTRIVDALDTMNKLLQAVK